MEYIQGTDSSYASMTRLENTDIAGIELYLEDIAKSKIDIPTTWYLGVFAYVIYGYKGEGETQVHIGVSTLGLGDLKYIAQHVFGVASFRVVMYTGGNRYGARSRVVCNSIASELARQYRLAEGYEVKYSLIESVEEVSREEYEDIVMRVPGQLHTLGKKMGVGIGVEYLGRKRRISLEEYKKCVEEVVASVGDDEVRVELEIQGKGVYMKRGSVVCREVKESRRDLINYLQDAEYLGNRGGKIVVEKDIELGSIGAIRYII